MMATNSLQRLLLAAIGLQMMLMVHSQRLPSRKTWWTKKITNDLHVAGRLSSSEIKFAREYGFKTLITVEFFPTTEYVGGDMTDPLISTPETAELAMNIDLKFAFIQNHSNWATLETVQIFSSIFDSSPKPAILNCKTGYSAVFIGLMHYFNRSKTDPSAQPRMNVTTFFQKGVTQGFDFAANEELKTLVLTVDGSVNATPKEGLPTLDIDITNRMAWKVKPLAKNIYLIGQIGSNQIPLLKAVGYKALVNLRKGVTSGGNPSQEESILLNIKDRIGTYDTNGNPFRQTRQVLESNRVNSTYATSYISPTSQYNYQSINVLQFGDAVGYNETLERLAVQKANLTYMHKPVGGVYKYGLPLWEAYKDSLLDLGNKSSGILFQCRTGYRSAVIGILLHGCLNGVNSSEALQLAYDLGYEFNNDSDTAVVTLFRTVLDNREEHCKMSPPTTTIPPPTTTIPPPTTTITSEYIAAATTNKTSVLAMVLLFVYGLCSLRFV